MSVQHKDIVYDVYNVFGSALIFNAVHSIAPQPSPVEIFLIFQPGPV